VRFFVQDISMVCLLEGYKNDLLTFIDELLRELGRPSWWNICITLLSKQCWGSVTFWCGSGSPDPYLLLMDQDPTPDPSPFFVEFKDTKKIIFFIFFLITSPVPTSTLSSVLKIYFFAKILC
jgi:hypothetical protein